MICPNPPDFEKRGGLVTAITQDHETGEILMVAYMNEAAFEKTLELGEVVYWSTSRNELWHKGESSGNTQILKELRIDCDADAVLVRVEQKGGAACHTGKRSCFFRVWNGEDWDDDGEQVFDPAEVYGK
ncbi:MAG: phosphoribosyl-AMP cyclohydrolase [Deltaproteobacteria bacterium]|nr:phosphoribosyl-AMP cyclohydrolase [Deltaproteobacteria bacterium]MBW2397013.1 phosphoribosyl-AMP cyclohydrolase [Deltaproteobacteria bacterium]